MGGFGASWRKVKGMVGIFVDFQVAAASMLFYFSLELMRRFHWNISIVIANHK